MNNADPGTVVEAIFSRAAIPLRSYALLCDYGIIQGQCLPAVLTADPGTDVEAMFDCSADAINEAVFTVYSLDHQGTVFASNACCRPWSGCVGYIWLYCQCHHGNTL